MTTLNLKAFAKCIVHSKLVEREVLETHARDCQQSEGRLTANTLAQYLVSKKTLTAYQARRLLQGRSEGFFLGGCRILDRLGEGGMGVVYLAQQERLDSKVALKVLPATQNVNDSSLKRFYREAKAAAKLKHSNIVQVFDVDHQDGTHFIVMELVNGKNLSELLKRDGVFTVGQALRLIRQAAEGLEHAHANGVIHRDIKPANLVLEDTTLKILDLGLARHEADDRLTGDQTIMGTLDYMSPEQCQDTAGVDNRSDIYSLGCTLYHMLIGRPPFTGLPQTGKLLAHVTELLPDMHSQNAAIPKSVNQIVQRMTAKQREQRYQSAAGLIADLDKLNQESNQQTLIAERQIIVGVVDSIEPADHLLQLSDEELSLSDNHSANSNTAIHSPQSGGWNFAFLISIMAVLVLAGVYMGIQLLKDHRLADQIVKNPADTNDDGTRLDNTSLNPSPSDAQQPPLQTGKASVPISVSTTEPSASPDQMVVNETVASLPAGISNDIEPVGTHGNTSSAESAMANDEDAPVRSIEKTPETLEPTQPEPVSSPRDPRETVLRSFTDDWQAKLVVGDILTLISPYVYELTAPVEQLKKLTIQGTQDKRAVLYMEAGQYPCWDISNCSLLFQHVDIYVSISHETASCNVFAVEKADLTLSDVSITIMEGGTQTWEDLSVIRVNGERELDVLAKATLLRH